eukprot:2649544-Pyramimonas_sp.AAC.1
MSNIERNIERSAHVSRVPFSYLAYTDDGRDVVIINTLKWINSRSSLYCTPSPPLLVGKVPGGHQKLLFGTTAHDAPYQRAAQRARIMPWQGDSHLDAHEAVLLAALQQRPL